MARTAAPQQVQEARLLHRQRGADKAGGTPWTEHPIRFERPAAGEPPAERLISCPDCDETFTYQVSSAAAARQAQQRWGRLTLATAVMAFVALAGMSAGSSSWFVGSSGRAVLFAVLGVHLLALVAAGLFAFLRADEQGIRGPGALFKGIRQHELRWPSSTRT